jgi:hypothetical protein
VPLTVEIINRPHQQTSLLNNYFLHFLFSFPQRVSEDINSIHIQFHVKITFAKKNLVTIQKYDMRVITKKVAIVKK